MQVLYIVIFDMDILIVNAFCPWLSGGIFYEETSTTYVDLILQGKINDETWLCFQITTKIYNGDVDEWIW